MNNEELTTEVQRLTTELENLKGLFYKNNFSDLQIFTKKVQFKSNVGFFSTNPIAQQSAISAPTAPGVGYVQAEAQSAVAKINLIIAVLKAFGLTA